MNPQAQITEILKQVAKKPIPPDPGESLFDSGVLDSFALPELVSRLESEFGISIPDADLAPRKFESIARIEAYLESRR